MSASGSPSLAAEQSKIFAIMQSSVDSLVRGAVISTPFAVTPSTVLLGGNSDLDSMGFVTFISDVEERVSKSSGKEVYIVLDQIKDFDISDPSLTAGHLADYLSQLIA